MNKKRISKGFWVWGQLDRQSEVKVEAAKELKIKILDQSELQKLLHKSS